MIKYIKENKLEEEIKSKKVLVDFFATWCGPCKMLGFVLEKFESKVDLPILKVDVDENDVLASEYKIFSVPTLILFENGKEVKRSVGLVPIDEIESLFED